MSKISSLDLKYVNRTWFGIVPSPQGIWCPNFASAGSTPGFGLGCLRAFLRQEGKTRRDRKIVSNFCQLQSEEGAEILISTGVPDPLEKRRKLKHRSSASHNSCGSCYEVVDWS